MGAQLVILAAGMGRRFGGLKQLTPVGPEGEAIMDYTVFDGLRAGFDEVVLVIRREIDAEIRAHVQAGLGRHVRVQYVHQEFEREPAGRTKPWGTGQAVLSAAALLHGPFSVANADDFYGAEALASLGAFLVEPPTTPPTWAVVGYRVLDTLPAEGSVSRGLLQVDGRWLRTIDEVHTVQRHPDGACRREGGRMRKLPASALVSMNLWGFGREIVEDLGVRFERFRGSSPGDDAEFYLPVSVGEAVMEGVARVEVLPTRGPWCGMTSPADLADVKGTLAGLVAEGVYPENLWRL